MFVLQNCSFSLVFHFFYGTVFDLLKNHQSQNTGVRSQSSRVRAVAVVFLVDHELLEGVEIRRDEGADGLVVIVENLFPSALGARGAG